MFIQIFENLNYKSSTKRSFSRQNFILKILVFILNQCKQLLELNLFYFLITIFYF